MIFKNINKNNIYFQIGLALMLIGVQFGTAIRNVFKIELVNLIMVLSFIMTCNFKNFIGFKFPSWNKYFAIILLFNLVELLYIGFNPEAVTQFLQYHLYIVACIISLSTQNKHTKIYELNTILFIISAFISIVVGYQVTKGFTGIYTENVLYDEISNTSGLSEGGDKITLGRALFLSIIVSYSFILKNIWCKAISVFLISISFLSIIMFSTRASIVCSIFCLFIYIIKKNNYGVTYLKKIILYLVLAFIMLIVLYFSVDYIQYQVNSFSFNTLRGIFTLFGNFELGVDESTITRYHTISKALSFFNDENFSVIRFLFGHGYFPYYIDVPILQAFYDFGLIGGSIYFYIVIITAIKFIKKQSNNDIIIILQLFAIHYLLDEFYCALPYLHFHYMPSILLIFIYNNKSICTNISTSKT